MQTTYESLIKQKPERLGEDYLESLDRLLQDEEAQTGKRVFKRGLGLRNGLFDVDSLMQNINALPTKKQSESQQWKQALKAMKRDPKLLFQALPSV